MATINKNQPDLKGVGMHDAFWRDGEQRSSETIRYPELGKHVREAETQEYPLLNAFWNSPEGSVDELRYARRAAEAYLIRTGSLLRTGNADQKQLVADRFTQASIEMYGEPEPAEAKNLAAQELSWLQGLRNKPQIDQSKLENQINFLVSQVGDAEAAEVLDDGIETAMAKIGEVIHHRYGDVLELFNLGQGKLSAEEVRGLFQKAIDKLGGRDPGWREWNARIGKGGAMSTSRADKAISVGNKARATDRLRGSFIHEALGHGLQGVNASKTGDPDLDAGLPNSHDAIEGVAVFLAAADRGRVSERAKDFYMDTAFALGQFGQKPISRPELQKLYLDRLILRAQAAGKEVKSKELEDKSWAYVNRIYRGSLGNEFVGVNTIDASYYRGFVQIARFAQKMLNEGKSPDEVFDYLSFGPFDPTNPMHIDHVEKVKAKLAQKENL